jgi:hypothetical protein
MYLNISSAISKICNLKYILFLDKSEVIKEQYL